MNMLTAEQDNIDMALTQMGAKVKSIHGLVCFVRFYINDVEIFYVYNVNAKDQYYLQKVLPFPVGAGVFTKPTEIIDYIKNDIISYRTASNSKNFSNFINTNLELHHIIHKLEDTFMRYNVPNEKMIEIVKDMEHINEILNEVQETSEIIKHNGKTKL